MAKNEENKNEVQTNEINEEIEEIKAEDVAESPLEEEKAEEQTEETAEISKEEELANEIAALRDKLVRNAAEFDNFKKRTAKERDELYSMGVCAAVEKLLPVKDNLERALTTIDGAEAGTIADGVKMIDKQFCDVLADIGVEVIPSVGEAFDPEKHDAVMHDDNEELGENTVSEEFMKGYMYKNKVIRHSMVKVSN